MVDKARKAVYNIIDIIDFRCFILK